MLPFVQPTLQSPDIDRFVRWLVLSEEQQVALPEACSVYEESWEAIRKKGMAELLALGEAGAQADPITPQNIKVIENLVRRNIEIRRRLDAVDRAFFVQLESILGEPQISAMARVRLDRARS